MLFFLPTAVMETCSSGEELTIKARKPYTITKQRERWTEEEHTRFLEALKLYGRAWQRIEEHIGTKTAVQIRSHAQKFFTKLEKEAVSKGIPLGQVHDIEIPPPRPKRKPTNPYPRKNGMGPTSPSGGGENDNRPLTRVPSSSYALNSKGKAEDLHADSHPQGQAGTKSQKRPKEASTDSASPGALSLFHVAPPPSTPSSSKSASQPNIPLPKDSHTEDEKDSGKMMDAHDPESQRVKVPGVSQNPSSVKLPSPSAVSSVHQSLPPYPPALSWPHIPPAFSGHLMSALLQNPASHTAANLAASYWLTADMEAAAIDSASGSTTGQQMSSSSHSMAAAAAATVAAASAWWATHGLLPFCYPSFNGCFATFAPPPTSPATQVKPQGDTEGEEEDAEEEEEEQEEQEEEKGLLRASKGKDMSLTGDVEAKGSPLSSTDSNRSGKEGVLDEGEEVKPRPAVENDQKSTLDAESINGKGKKQVDRSSCGSNTPGSEVETDTVPPGADKAEDEEPNEPVDSSGRRPVDPRKEVSKEGRLAFQALFSREVLPQSFSPPKEEATALPPEVNDIVPLKVNAVNPVKVNLVDLSSSAREEAAVGQQRLKPQCTGFKPYKRCAVEAKEAKPLANEEECNKRIRLEREASTRAS